MPYVYLSIIIGTTAKCTVVIHVSIGVRLLANGVLVFMPRELKINAVLVLAVGVVIWMAKLPTRSFWLGLHCIYDTTDVII